MPAQLSLADIWNIRPYPKGWAGLPETLAQPVPLYLKNMAAHYWFEHLPDTRPSTASTIESLTPRPKTSRNSPIDFSGSSTIRKSTS